MRACARRLAAAAAGVLLGGPLSAALAPRQVLLGDVGAAARVALRATAAGTRAAARAGAIMLRRARGGVRFFLPPNKFRDFWRGAIIK